MIKVHKIKIIENNKQATYFAQASGVARFAYNWALDNWSKQYQAGLSPSESKLRKELNAIKQEKYPWMLEVTKVAPQQSIKNLGNAFARFFKRQGKYPQFKKKGQHDAFRADNGPAEQGANAVEIKDYKVKLPIIGWVKLTERIRFKGQIKSVVISKRANYWYAAISVDVNEAPYVRKNHGIAGVDLGISTLATISTGEKIAAVKPYNKELAKLARLSRQLSRKQLGSNNRKRARGIVAKLHNKIANIRSNIIHNLTTKLVRNFSGICIEDLNVSGMLKNRKLARHIMDCGFYEFRRQLEYKCQWYQAKLVVADRFFASSKCCNCCNVINKELTLTERIWQCICGIIHDRDLNAALNLKQYFLNLVRLALPELTLVEKEALTL